MRSKIPMNGKFFLMSFFHSMQIFWGFRTL
jgi:hypothetical protein